MKQLENYFKTRKEVEAYFQKEVFRFTFMSDNIMTFRTLMPKIIDGQLLSFELSFYYVDCETFFDYSSFEEWLDNFQLSTVTGISDDTGEQVILYFKEYDDKKADLN